MLNSFLTKECFEERLSKDKVIKTLLTFIENQERSIIFKALKEFFSLAMKNTHRVLTYNCARIGLELCREMYSDEEFPKKNISYIVEIIVYGLSEAELKADAEALLVRILKNVPREELRKIFELELINSFKLYQVFLYWLDSEELPMPSPREEAEYRNEILIEDHDEHPNL